MLRDGRAAHDVDAETLQQRSDSTPEIPHWSRQRTSPHHEPPRHASRRITERFDNAGISFLCG